MGTKCKHVRVRYIERSFFDRDGMAKQKHQAVGEEVLATRPQEKSRRRSSRADKSKDRPV
jgi:hypothetical protein